MRVSARAATIGNAVGQAAAGGIAPPEKPRSRDVHQTLHFWVEIDNVQVAGFAECSPLIIETEVFDYAEGGLNIYTHKLPVRTKYSNITLKRGLDPGQDLYQWFMTSLDGKAPRKNVTISIYPPEGGDQPVRSYHLFRAFPVKWTGPDLKTDAGAVAIESLEFAHDGLIILEAR
jgi:phage tail-like protein